VIGNNKINMEKDIIILDLETKKTFDEVGGQENRHLLGVTVVGVYSYQRDEYRAFREEEFGELLELFKNTKLVIGFNSISFDFTVLQPYFKEFDLSTIPHLDILKEVYDILGFRLKLESLAQTTLGYGKSGSGLDAIKYHRNNEWDKLIKYCLDDVKVTKELYEYGLNHGHLWYLKLGQKEKIIINWSKGIQKIEDKVKEAFQNGKQILIDYIDSSGNITQRKIDIQSINGNKIKAFCHLREAIRLFDLDRIKKVEISGKMANWQDSLL